MRGCGGACFLGKRTRLSWRVFLILVRSPRCFQRLELPCDGSLPVAWSRKRAILEPNNIGTAPFLDMGHSGRTFPRRTGRKKCWRWDLILTESRIVNTQYQVSDDFPSLHVYKEKAFFTGIISLL